MPCNRRSSLRLPTRFSILVGGCIAAAAGCHRSEPPGERAAPTPPPATSAQRAPAPGPGPSAAAVQLPSGRTIADVAAQVTPSVVNVFSERRVHRGDSAPFLTDPFFQYFFGAPRDVQRAPQRERSLGSGVIVSPDGVILTNNHVVENAETIKVALKDGRDLEARLVGTDPQSDIAVLRVDQEQLPAIEIADSAKTRIGDLVLAIGNPFGIGQTVTMGIISAVGRANMGITDYEDFIQTDAAINPGNSGGALIDMDGKLVGINTAIASQTGGYQGIGFAIPSNMAMQIEKAILRDGKVTRGWLGVAAQDVTSDLARSMDHLTPHHGVLVSDVTRGSPAAGAGIQRGDVITAIDGAAISEAGQLRTLIALAGKDRRVAVQLERHGKPMTLQVTLREAPTGRQAQAQIEDGVLSGLAIQPLDRALRDRLRVPDGVVGVVVTGVDRRGPAAALLRAGDVILEINHQPVATVEAFRDAARAAGDRALLLVVRSGVALYVTLSR